MKYQLIIAQSPCALLKSYVPKGKCVAIPEKCKKCGLCLASGCPAITKNEDGTISIDQTLCNGCGLCMQNCHFDAIELKKKGRISHGRNKEYYDSRCRWTGNTSYKPYFRWNYIR